MPGRDQKSMPKDAVPAYRRLERAGRTNLGTAAQAFGTAAEFENPCVAAGLMCHFKELDTAGKAHLAEVGRAALATLLPEAEGPCADIIVRLPLAVQGKAPDVCRSLAALRLKRSRRVVPYIEFAGAADPDAVARIVGPVGGRVTVIATPHAPAAEEVGAADDPVGETPASSDAPEAKTDADSADATHGDTPPDEMASGTIAEPPAADAPATLADVPCAADEQVPPEADAAIATPVLMPNRRSVLALPQRPKGNPTSSLSTFPVAANHSDSPLVSTAQERIERGLMTEHDRLDIP